MRLVIGRRLERVSEECRGVLVRAATIGRAFRFELLQAIAEIKDDSLLDTVDEAERGYLLRSDPDGRLSFTHELIRQTLLAGLSAPRRQRLHLRVAQALEELHTENLEPHIAELAEHYRRAGAAGSLDKAIDYSLKAGNIAQSLFALEEAESHWRAASDLMEQAGRPPKERADLLARLGSLVFSMGFDEYPRSIDFSSRALALYEEAGDLEDGANMHVALAVVFNSNTAAMDFNKSRSHLLAAQHTLSTGPARPPQIRLYTQLAQLARWQLHTEEGLEACERGMAIAEELGQPLQTSHSATVPPTLIQSVYGGYGIHLMALGRLKDAFEAWAKQRQMAEEQNEALAGFLVATNGVPLTMLGDPREGQRFLRYELGRPRQARTNRRRALLSFLGASLVTSGDLTEAELIVSDLGEDVFDQEDLCFARPQLAFRRGDWDKSERLWRTARDRHKEAGNRWAYATFALALAGLACVRGDFSAAEELLETVLAIGLDGPHALLTMIASAELALLYGDNRQPQKAPPHLERCREILARGENWRGLAGRVGLAEAVVAGAEGNVDDAERHFEGALAVFRRYSLPWDEAEALLQRGRMYTRSRRRHPPPDPSFDAAVDIYRRHGAGQRWIDRVEAVRSAAPKSGSRPIEPVSHYPAGLSEREAEVLRLIASGKSNQQIADELVISLNTVFHHVGNIFNKRGAANRTEAAAYAHRQGLA